MNIRLAGLEEKFRILNNDELADALHDRILELSLRSEKCIPEALSLLLQLSDQPTRYSRIEDLEALKPKPPPVPLTWAEILKDDPLDNRDGLWDNVDFADNDSKEENENNQDYEDNNENKATQNALRELNSSSLTRGRNEESGDFEFNADQYELNFDNKILGDLRSAPYWGNGKTLEEHSSELFASSKVSKSVKLTEGQLKREVIFMLLGLPTPILRQNSEGYSASEFLDIHIEHMSPEALKHLLSEFAALSDSLAKTRTWVKRIETVAVLQAFQAGLSSRINAVERAFSDIQSRMLNPASTSTSSLLDLFNKVSVLTRNIQQIAAMLDNLQTVSTPCVSYQLLESLYDRTCLNHITEDSECFIAMATLFFECFDVYLRPVRAWMQFGMLNKQEKAFFIRESAHGVAPDKLWREQFQLIETEARILQAPRFLHVTVQKIFTAGKSVNFLKRLGRFHSDEDSSALFSQKLDYETVCRDTVNIFTPFSTLFDISLERWIANVHRTSSHRLREVLETECGLSSSLDELEIVYFNRNGAISGDVAKLVFDRIDSSTEVWNDSFVLTELFQDTLSKNQSIDVDRLAVRSVEKSCQVVQDNKRSVKILESLKVWYDLPWPIANIIKTESIDIYQRIFVILTQVQRAKNILQRKNLLKRVLSPLKSEDRENRLAHYLRQCFLWFTNSLLTYLTNSVLWVESEEMRRLMIEAGDVDEMISVHEKFISSLENQCLISKNLAPIHQAVITILDLSILFSDAHASYQAQLILSQPMMTTAGVGGILEKGRWKTQDATSESSYDGDEDLCEADLSYISFEETPYAERLKNIQASFTDLVSSIITGLYGIHKVGREQCLEMLANNLATGLGREGLD